MIVAYISIALLAVACIVLAYKIQDLELKQVNSATQVKKDLDTRIDSVIRIHNASVDHFDDEIDVIVDRMAQIIKDIDEIDHNEREIRSYYVNFRQPVNTGGGVSWAPDYPTREEPDLVAEILEEAESYEIHNN